MRSKRCWRGRPTESRPSRPSDPTVTILYMNPTTVLIPPEEKAELDALAKQAHVSLGFAMRQGARLFLSARLAEAPKRGPKAKT